MSEPNPQREALVMAREALSQAVEYARVCAIGEGMPSGQFPTRLTATEYGSPTVVFDVKAARASIATIDAALAAPGGDYHGYHVGDRVRHDLAGEGVVAAILRDGLSVSFESGAAGIYDHDWFHKYGSLLRPTPTQDGGDG